MNLSRMILGVVLAALALPAAAAATEPPRPYYVSLGDSYATGYQPTGQGEGSNTRNGFAYQVPKLARQKGFGYRLVNFGCGGETTVSLLERTSRCAGPGPGGVDYAGRTQIAAAARFIRRHRGRVGLVTVSIGGNDVTRCAREATPIPCVVAAVQAITENVTRIAKRLRRAGGRKLRIVGITYPDVILGQWVGENPDHELAKLSVAAFKDFINPALSKAYAAAGATFVDVTAASGAYGSFDQLAEFPSGALVPGPVADVCRLTYYCQWRDIHAPTSGYRLIAELIVGTLPNR